MASSSSQSQVNINTTCTPADPRSFHETQKDPSWYLPLYIAALKGDWESAEKFFELDPDAITAKVMGTSRTALQIAVGTGKANHFVKNLVEIMPPDSLAQPDHVNQTALSMAATVGNIEAAKLLLQKNADLPYILDSDGVVPVHRAAQNSHRDMLQYLIDITRGDFEPCPLSGESGAFLLCYIINAGFYDIALDLVQRYPKMPTAAGRGNPLAVLASQPSAFPSGSHLNFWQRILYSSIFVKLENFPKHPKAGDMENPKDSSQVCYPVCGLLQFFRGMYSNSVCQKLQGTLWQAIEAFVPHIKHIRDTKLMHHQVIQLVKNLCKETSSLENSLRAGSIFNTPTLMAAKYGIREIVEEITDSFPYAILFADEFDRDVIKQAIMCRQENVFNLIYQMGEHKQSLLQSRDKFGDTILHLAGLLAPPHRLNLVSGAAFQMQRELHWFKEVEKFVLPSFRNIKNLNEKTPQMVFSEEHKQLVMEGEKWMKDTANSCTVAAALIATVVFAAAISVPGGNNGDSGLPIFSRQKAFIVFAVSDALSLFSSSASVLMFLSILTSRYAEADFLYALPKRLIIGLVTLFLSIASMMGAFSATLYIVFGDKNPWILSLIAAAACLPITLFAFLIFPLLMEMISSTYGPGIFGKQSDRPFY